VLHLTLEQGSGVWTMLGVGAAAVALTVYGYRRTHRRLGSSRWRLLLLLRLVAVVLVVLLLFRPVCSFERAIVQKRALLFLIDSSASMETADDDSGTSRFDQARSRIVEWWPRLRKDFDLHLFEFSDRATALEGPEALAQVKPTGPATSLIRGLATAAQKVPRGDIEAVILLSDGVHNAAGDPAVAAQKLGLVVHTVGVGNTLRGSSYRDVQVSGVECAEQLPVNNQAWIKGFIEAVGFGGRVVKVILEEDGKQLQETDLVLDDKEGVQEVAFQFLPTVKGRHTYTIRVPVQPEEKIGQNNHRAINVQVIDVRLRVLYVEGTLRAEFGALVDRFLARDPDIEFCALVQTRPNVFVQRTNISGLKLTGLPTESAVLDKFDVFVLGDLDSTYLKPAQMELLTKRVRAGAGLVMLGGYHSLGPGGYAGTPLEEVLPVLVGSRDIGQLPLPFVPALTADGRQHAIFANIAAFFPGPNGEPAKATLPPLEGCVKVHSTKPGATILAVYPGEKGPGGSAMPVLAVQPVGKGRTAVFTGDTTRNWHQVPHALDQKSPFARFWGQLVRWLANRSEAVASGVTARTDKTAYEPESTVTIHAVVRDKEAEGTRQAYVIAHIKGPLGKTEMIQLSPAPSPAGHYSGTFDPKTAGSYEIVVEAQLSQGGVGGRPPTTSPVTLKTDMLPIEIGRPNLEFDRLDLDDKMLKRIAAETGGRYAHISTADRLIEHLNRQEQRRHVVLEQPLYWPPAFWLLFAGLLSGEWILRKRYQLR
jgi:uncharacterized membrane protein